MNEHSGTTNSVWMRTTTLTDFPKLQQNDGADVCIVGAGIAGLTTAYLLLRAGASVVVLDDGPVGAGETERTTAHLSNALDDRYTFLERKHGQETARLAAESHTAAISEIETIARNEQIDCDFERVDGYLFVPRGVDPQTLVDEKEAAHRAGLIAVELVDKAPWSLSDISPVLRFPGQAQFHPWKYLGGLLVAIQKLGGKIFANSRAYEMNGGDPCSVVTQSGARVACKSIVVATNSPVNDRVAMHTKQAAYRSYVVGLKVPKGTVPTALYWDTAQDADEQRLGHQASYHYVRLQRLNEADDLLIVGGEDHKTGQARDMDERWKRLEKWTRERAPHAGDVAFRWSGQVMEPFDGMAFIGRNPGDGEQGVFIATGDSGHGMTHGTIAGMLLRDLILGRKNPWEDIYDPRRSAVKAAGEFISENLNVAGKYTELIGPGEMKSRDELSPGCGAVIRRGTSKIAVYRDAHGSFHEFSAVCPHLKCIVHWNPGEQSWDCPCHGSRFTASGQVVNGPSLAGLSPVKEEPAKTAAK